MSAAADNKWTLVQIGNNTWLYRLDGDEPFVYYYHEQFRNFVRAPLYVNPVGPDPSMPPGAPVQ
jgi:hypothetical protein